MYENIVEASKFLTDTIEKIGIPGEVSQENSIDTLFKGLEKIITFIKNGITGGGDTNEVINRINESITAQTVTLSEKLEDSTNTILRKIEELPRRFNTRNNCR